MSYVYLVSIYCTYKKLLEFFITVIDAELFKTVGVKYFKTVDVEHSNQRSSVPGRRNLDGGIDFAYNPSEESVIYSLPTIHALYLNNHALYTHTHTHALC